MHAKLPRISLFLGVLALAAPSASSQDVPSKDDLERMRKELEEMKRANDEFMHAVEREAIDAEATLARLGGSIPWPPPDPAASSPEAWRAALLGAEELSAARAFEAAPVLRVRVTRSPSVAALFDDDQALMVEAVAAVHRTGRRTHPDKVITLRLGAGITPGNGVLTTASLTIPARVLHQGQVHHAEVELAHFADLHGCVAALTREDVQVGYDRVLSGLFAKLTADATRPADADAALGDRGITAIGAWADWLADASRAAELRRAFEASARPEDQLGPGLDALRGFRSLEIDVEPRPGEDEARTKGRVPWLREHWTGLLETAQLAETVPDAPRLVHEVRWGAPPDGAAPTAFAEFSARLALGEDVCLAVLDDRWVWVRGDSWSATGFFDVQPYPEGHDIPFVRWVDAAIGNSALGELEYLRKERERGSRPPVPPHPDGEAAANFLRTRARVDVPEAVLADYANLIARTLAEAPGIPAGLRAEWKLQVDGQTQLYLPYVGAARSGSASSRSVRDAVRAATDRILLADPMAGIAFYDIWMHERGYRRPVLPDGFADELRGPRPTGPGALCNVAVVDAYEYACKRLMREGAPRGGALEQAVDALRPQLESAKVLECEYIPADASTSYTLVRTFWYRSAPADWDATSARLPRDFPLAATGPTRTAAPKTLAGADR